MIALYNAEIYVAVSTSCASISTKEIFKTLKPLMSDNAALISY